MNKEAYAAFKAALPNLQENVLLRDHTTFKIGGPAEYFLTAADEKTVMDAIALAKNIKIPVFVLGGGSNLLVKDKGVKGLVIKLENNDNYVLEDTVIAANAGVELKKLVSFSVKNSLKGLEWAGGLPGSLGGAIRGNAGAFGGETKDSVLEVTALDSDFNLRKFQNTQCQFSYRNSIFKQNNWVVLSAKLQLTQGNKIELEEAMNSHIQYRSERHPLEYPNAGSVFKNMDVKDFSPDLQKQLASVIKRDPFPVIPTAYLISEAGLKGKTVGKAQVSSKHPNFIVNLGGAKAQDVLELIDVVKKTIKEKYGVVLETEVQIIGD